MEPRPWRRAFWIGECDARILALFRIGLSSVMLFDLLDRLQDFGAFYTDQGLMPRGPMLEAFVRTWRFSVYDMAGTPLLVGALLFVHIAGVVALGAGYRTRLASVLVWIFSVSLQERNLVINDGGDNVMRVMAFWLMWADSGAAWSLDLARGRRTSDGRAPILPLRFMQLQVCVVYFMAGISKTGTQWHDGTALFHALQLRDWARPFGQSLLLRPKILAALTHATLWVELGFPFITGVQVGVVRAPAIAAVLGLHLGIFATMRVGLFSTVMPVTMTLFVLPQWIDFVEKRLGRARPLPPPIARRFPPLHAILVLQMAFIFWGQSRLHFLPRVRQFAAHEVELMGLWQNWAMFAPNPLGEDGYWRGPGKLVNGIEVDVLGAVAPRMMPDGNFYFTRWAKYRSELYANSYGEGAMRMFANWVCRSFNKAAPNELQLAEFDLIYWQIPTHGPNEPEREAKRVPRWNWKCGGVTPRPAKPALKLLEK